MRKLARKIGWGICGPVAKNWPANFKNWPARGKANFSLAANFWPAAAYHPRPTTVSKNAPLAQESWRHRYEAYAPLKSRVEKSMTTSQEPRGP